MTPAERRAALVEKVARELAENGYAQSNIKLADPYTADAEFWNAQATAALAVALEEAASPAFLRPLIEEQSAGEWDEKTINNDVAMFSAAIRALIWKEKA